MAALYEGVTLANTSVTDSSKAHQVGVETTVVTTAAITLANTSFIPDQKQYPVLVEKRVVIMTAIRMIGLAIMAGKSGKYPRKRKQPKNTLQYNKKATSSLQVFLHSWTMDSPIQIQFEARKLQIRPENLTVKSLAKIFHIVPETVILISAEGTVSVPDDEGKFGSLTESSLWTVEGDPSSFGQSGSKVLTTSESKWKPKPFIPKASSSRPVS